MPYAYKDKTCWGSCVKKTIFPSETKCKREELIQSLGGYFVPSVAIGLIHPFQQDYKYLQALWNVQILPQFCLISCKYVCVINLAGEQSDQPLHESRANLLPFPPHFSWPVLIENPHMGYKTDNKMQSEEFWRDIVWNLLLIIPRQSQINLVHQPSN